MGWKASSPIPYSNWLEIASTQQITLESLAIAKSQHTFDEATQDPLPDYQDYLDQDPLRAAIKLLKRHRDEWAIRTKNEDYRPISAVITTLATHAYLDVVEESRFEGNRSFIYNPKDNGENFAEKWNKPLKGQRYSQAFQEWHLSARESVSLGLENFESAESFAKAVKENFGMGGTFISDVNNEIPANWSMPGRPTGTTRNSLAMGSLFGGLVAGATSQEDIKPVERLG